MAKIADNRKFISLEGVRVSYRPKDDSIQITSTDEDLAGANFHLVLNKNSEAEKALRSLLIEQGIIQDNLRAEESQSLPATSISHNHQAGSFEWNEFPLGVDARGTFIWDANVAAHMYVAGHTGAGKSVILENVYEHCRTNQWKIYGIDFKQVELSSFDDAQESFEQLAHDKNELLTMLDELLDIVHQRLSTMAGTDLMMFPVTEEAPRIMLLIDEAWVLEQEGLFTAEELMRVQAQFAQLLRFGRVAGLHVVAASQRPGQQLKHFDARVVMGRANHETSLTMLKTMLAASLPKINGRGLAKVGNKLTEFQAYLPLR